VFLFMEKESKQTTGFPIELVPYTLLSLLAFIFFWAPWFDIQIPGIGKMLSGYDIAKIINVIYIVPIFFIVMMILAIMLDLGKVDIYVLKNVTNIGSLFVIIAGIYMWYEVYQTINQASDLLSHATNMPEFSSILGQMTNFTAWFYGEVIALIGIAISVFKMRI
jgi:hypothetical protein